MQISKPSLNILKNFSSINGSILIEEGNTIKTVSPAKNLFAKYSCEENFPVEVPIYDLNEFLSSVNLFEDPELDFKKNFVNIKNNKQKLKYNYSDPEVVDRAPTIKEEMFANPLFSFTLGQDVLAKILKASNICDSNIASIEVTDGKVKMVTINSSNPDSNQYEVDMGEVDYGETGQYKILVENLKMLNLNYEVSIHETFIRFLNAEVNVEYIIAIEE